MTDYPEKGFVAEIDLTQSARQRIHCGLSWDSPEGTEPADLDVSCVMFGEKGEFMDAVSGVPGETHDASRYVLHSGDEASGADIFDDERISADLFDLPDSIRHIIFIVTVRDGRSFGTVAAPRARIADSIANRDFMATPLDRPEGTNSNAFVFCHLERDGIKWSAAYIGDYMNRADVGDWPSALLAYLPHTDGFSKERGPRTTGIPKGEKTSLDVAKDARRRIICGLRWDASGSRKNKFDLDLACILFDRDGGFVDSVSSLPEEAIDSSGAVYHSGDNDSGASAGDDEAISVELARLPDAVHHVVFIAMVQSGHTFGSVYNPEIRLADAKTDKDQIRVALSEGGAHTALIFAQILRHGGGWVLHHIGAYKTGVEDWVAEAEKYLSVP